MELKMLNIHPHHEQQFNKEATTNQNGLIVGEFNPNLLNHLELVNHANWDQAITANNLRSRYDNLEEYISNLGPMKPSLKEKIRFAIDELIMNSEMHGDAHQTILLSLRKINEGIWINCKDKGGHFSLEAGRSLYQSIFEDKLTPSFDGLGAGIGLGMITKMSSQIHIRCQKDKETVVSAFIPDVPSSGLKSFSFIIY